MSFDHVMATACTQTITLLYIYLCVWELDLRLNNINLYQLFLLILLITYYHYLLILNLWNTTKFKYYNQWVAYLWYFLVFKFIKRFCYMTKLLDKAFVEICKSQKAFYFLYLGRIFLFIDCLNFIIFYLYFSSSNYHF